LAIGISILTRKSTCRGWLTRKARQATKHRLGGWFLPNKIVGASHPFLEWKQKARSTYNSPTLLKYYYLILTLVPTENKASHSPFPNEKPYICNCMLHSYSQPSVNLKLSINYNKPTIMHKNPQSYIYIDFIPTRFNGHAIIFSGYKVLQISKACFVDFCA
jgi:hypothetical protein